MTKAILIIWAFAGSYSSTMSTEKFDTMTECNTARRAMIEDKWVKGWITERNSQCVPYNYPGMSLPAILIK